MENLPLKFECGIGGYCGGSYSIKLLPNGVLEYMSSDFGYDNWKTELILPSQELWEELRLTLDSIDVWKWQEYYANKDGIVDGTNWGIEIEYKVYY